MLGGGNCTRAGALIVVVPAALAAGYSWLSDRGTATAQISPFWRGIVPRGYDKIADQIGGDARLGRVRRRSHSVSGT
jgi:hypothetical protein